MGLFDFFKKKKPASVETPPESPVSDQDANAMLMYKLTMGIQSVGYFVERHPDYNALIINKELEIAPTIIPGDHHPMLLQVLILAVHAEHFPEGIEDMLPGLGRTLEARVDVAVHNYLNTVFKPIAMGLSDQIVPELDMKAVINGKEILFHPKIGDIGVQGNWKNPHRNEVLYDLVKGELPRYLKDQTFNWLKLYVGRMQDGSINADCFLNNVNWPEGKELLRKNAAQWGQPGEFLGQKQFCVIRKSDTQDE